MSSTQSTSSYPQADPSEASGSGSTTSTTPSPFSIKALSGKWARGQPLRRCFELLFVNMDALWLLYH